MGPHGCISLAHGKDKKSDVRDYLLCGSIRRKFMNPRVRGKDSSSFENQAGVSGWAGLQGGCPRKDTKLSLYLGPGCTDVLTCANSVRYTLMDGVVSYMLSFY